MSLTLTPGSTAAVPPKCERGVYVAAFTEHTGYRWVWSVNSEGVRVALKDVPPGADFNPVIDALWDELDMVDPTPAAASSPPAFRLIA